MQRHYIFFLKPTYGQHFYYKGSIVYQFLKDYLCEEDPLLKLQGEAVLKKVDREMIMNQFVQAEKNTIDVSGNDLLVYHVENPEKQAQITLYSSYLVVTSPHLAIAEELIFRYLKKLQTPTFVMDLDQTTFGWMNNFSKTRKQEKELYQVRLNQTID